MKAELTSKLTVRGQTTVPTGVRQALRLAPGDELAYVVRGEVVELRRRQPAIEERDPALATFLAVLARDLERRPGAVSAMPPGLRRRIEAAARGVAIDHGAPIDGAIPL